VDGVRNRRIGCDIFSNSSFGDEPTKATNSLDEDERVRQYVAELHRYLNIGEPRPQTQQQQKRQTTVAGTAAVAVAGGSSTQTEERAKTHVTSGHRHRRRRCLRFYTQTEENAQRQKA